MTTTAMRTAGIWIDDGYILLSRGVEMSWGIPGGKLEPDESAEAVRQMR
jgi:8-oxo-dGTP pyrophosphatase MutT (NUDIX family)